MTAKLMGLVEPTIVSVLLAGSQVFLKQVLLECRTGGGMAQLVVAIARSLSFWLAVASTAIAAVCWIRVLSHSYLAVACPTLGLWYFFVVAASWHFFGEPVTPVRWMGVALVCAGMALVNIHP